MKNKFLKFSALAISAIFCFAAIAGCSSKKPNDGNDEDDVDISGIPNLNNGYTYSKQNDEGLMQFYSSDSGLDDFLNEYMRRHLRYDDDAIHDLKVGSGNTVWKEWETMSVAWMNTAGIGYSPKTTIGNWFSSIYQDAFGYIWFDNGSSISDWGQSWEFPNWAHSYYGGTTTDVRTFLNTTYFNGLCNIPGDKNGSNELTEIWTAVDNYGNKGTLGKNTTDFWDYVSNVGNDIRKITYTYDSTTTEKETKGFMATPFCSPFLELDFSITDYDSLGSTNQVEDVVVWWKGGSGEKNTEWNEEHCVKYSEFSSNYKETFSSATHIVFPMYAHENWGTSQEFEDAITDMKIELIFKNGINAEVRLEEVTFSFDGRQVNNNSVFIAAAAYYYQYTQDDEWLAQNIDKIRAAMQFLMTYCGSEDEKTDALITTERLVGHDGSSNYDYYVPGENGTYGYFTNYKSVGRGIGDGYWDCLSNPCINLYTNMYYYKALSGMAYLEKMVKDSGITESGNEVKVRPADWGDTVTYSETADSLQEKMSDFLSQFQTYFWNEDTGRFLLGYLSDDDPGVVAGVLDTKVDYGFTTYNQEVIELGLATAEQASSIQDWINGERKVTGDTADNSSKAKQIYFYSFAPRWTTKENLWQYWYRFNGARSGSYGWNKQVQNGGTALHCAYYDIVATNIANGVDDSYSKLKGIETWYNTVKDAGGSGVNFYREYYEPLAIYCQGGNTSGVLGVDYEFIEATLLYASVPVTYFGLGSTEYNTLNVTPNLPSDLDYWKMENLSYASIYYDLTIGDNWIQINSIAGDNTGLKVRVTLDAPAGDFEVRQHSTILVKDKDYVVTGGKVIITAPFQNGRIQIVNK